MALVGFAARVFGGSGGAGFAPVFSGSAGGAGFAGFAPVFGGADGALVVGVDHRTNAPCDDGALQDADEHLRAGDPQAGMSGGERCGLVFEIGQGFPPVSNR